MSKARQKVSVVGPSSASMLWLPIPFSACVHINPWTAVQTTPDADVVSVSALRGSSQGAHSKRGAAYGRVQVVVWGFQGRSVPSTRISWIGVAHADPATPQLLLRLSGVMTRKSLRARLCL